MSPKSVQPGGLIESWSRLRHSSYKGVRGALFYEDEKGDMRLELAGFSEDDNMGKLLWLVEGLFVQSDHPMYQKIRHALLSAPVQDPQQPMPPRQPVPALPSVSSVQPKAQTPPQGDGTDLEDSAPPQEAEPEGEGAWEDEGAHSF